VRVIFLGTNGWYDTDTGNSICTLIETEKASIILDAGNGFYKLDRYRASDDGREAYLLLSHFHLDHVVGLHTLNKFRFPQGLTVCGPTGSRDILNTFVNRPFTAPLADLPYNTTIHEMPEEKNNLGITVDAKPLLHADPTIGYRIEADGKVISYCPDTGYCENAVELSRSADLLIAECAYRSGQGSESWPHLNPETAARIACEAGAKCLALVHFDAQLYPTLEDRRESEAVARGLFPNTFAAMDDLEIEV
jgi:ribonuclease BN (tRNA processing enzyme)